MESVPPLGRPRSETRQRQMVMGLRVDKREADEIRRRARERGLTVSAFLRCAVLGSVKDGDCATPVEAASDTHSQPADQSSAPT